MIAQTGKFLLVLSLCLQGSLLIQGLDAQKNFNANLTSLAAAVPQLACLNDHTAHFDYIRYAVAGLYFISILFLVFPCPFVVLFTVVGVVANTALLTVPTLLKDPQDQLATITVLKNLAILGGLVYLMGSNKCPMLTKKVKTD